jgi:serine/threonine protein kinase
MLELLGSGSSAVVRKCIHLGTKEQYAVKIINQQNLRLQTDAAIRREQLVREIKLLSKLKHQHIVNMHDYVETPDTLFVVMELVEVPSR